MIRLTLIVAFLVAVTTSAEAKHHHYKHSNSPRIERPIGSFDIAALPAYPTEQTRQWPSKLVPMGRKNIAPSNGYSMAEQIIGGRPAGAPHAYCGYAARIYLGIDDTRLNLAWNWTKYYHGSTPVAVWPHHVAIIIQRTGPGTALLRDYNSGGGLSRIHERSLAGARIIGGGMASL